MHAGTGKSRWLGAKHTVNLEQTHLTSISFIVLGRQADATGYLVPKQGGGSQLYTTPSYVEDADLHTGTGQGTYVDALRNPSPSHRTPSMVPDPVLCEAARSMPLLNC